MRIGPTGRTFLAPLGFVSGLFGLFGGFRDEFGLPGSIAFGLLAIAGSVCVFPWKYWFPETFLSKKERDRLEQYKRLKHLYDEAEIRCPSCGVVLPASHRLYKSGDQMVCQVCARR